MTGPKAGIFPSLKLPKRYEALEREVTAKDADLKRIVHRVDAAASRVETLLRQVRDGGLGRFEVFLGLSGSGKTTFFKTLTQFFSGTEVREVPENIKLSDVAGYIRGNNFSRPERVVWVLYDRDNPVTTEEEAFAFFESLRILFREAVGKIVLIWPITDVAKAKMLSNKAWEVGRDSVVDLNRGLYEFRGPPREEFVNVADLTAKSLYGQGLEIFGLTKDIVDPLAGASETISEFFSRLETKSAEINGLYRDLLKDKVLPSVWILVAGDDSKDLNLTVANLTQGTQKDIDIDRIVKYLDDPKLDAAYLKEWKKKRSQIAFLLRALDVRIFELPPNVVLPAIRAFGDTELKKNLKLQSTSESIAIDAVSKAAFFRALRGEDYGRVAYLRATDQQTSQEYLRIQAKASSDDKRLNKAIGLAIEKALNVPGIEVVVKAEIKAPGSNLKPDIRISFPDGRVVCIEPTWRSTGAGIPGEIAEKQNTLTVGHIQKYLLEKLLGYVNDLNL